MTELPDQSNHRDQWETAVGLTPRLISAAWFAVAACIPVVLILHIVYTGPEANFWGGFKGRWSFIEFPVSLAAFFGFAIGSRILDLRKTQSAFRAMLRGMVVAVASYLAMPVITVVVRVFSASPPGSGHLSFSNLVYWMLVIYGVGAILFGWFVVIAGGAAGYLLQRLSRKEMLQKLVARSRVSARRAYWLNGGFALVLVAANACFLVFPSLLSGSVGFFFQILDPLAPADGMHSLAVFVLG
jgi:hypothetical protein